MKLIRSDTTLECILGRELPMAIAGILLLALGIGFWGLLLEHLVPNWHRVSPLYVALFCFACFLTCAGILALFGAKGFTIDNSNDLVEVWRYWVIWTTRRTHTLSDFNWVSLCIWNMPAKGGSVPVGTCTLHGDGFKVALFQLENRKDAPREILDAVVELTGLPFREFSA